MPDVDIDFFDRDGVLKLFKHTPATIIKEDKIEKHKNIQLSVDTPNDLNKIKLIFKKALYRNKNFVIGWEEIVSIYNSIEVKN